MSILNNTAFLNNNSFFTLTGVGILGNGKDTVISCTSFSKDGNFAKLFTAINIVGWIPGVSIIAGIASVFLGGYISREDKLAAVALVSRGILQIAQVGIFLAPFDIGFSLARLVRENEKRQAALLAQ